MAEQVLIGALCIYFITIKYKLYKEQNKHLFTSITE